MVKREKAHGLDTSEQEECQKLNDCIIGMKTEKGYTRNARMNLFWAPGR